MKIKVTGLINKDKFNAFSLNSNRKNPIIFTLAAIVGISVGVVCETIYFDVYSTIIVNYVGYFNQNSCLSFIKSALTYTAYNSIFIMFSMILGVCAVGRNFLSIIPFVKGLGIGAACACMYSAYAFKGVIYSALIIFLPALLELIAIILACSESFLMSKEILLLITQKENENTVPDMRLYVLRYAVIMLITVFSGIMYALMMRIFSAVVI